jgi:hypothetical protein
MKLATATRCVNPSFSSSSRIDYLFVPLPQNVRQRVKSHAAISLLVVLIEFSRRGRVDPSHRELGAEISRTARHVQRLLRELRDAGLIRWRTRRISRTRCLTNIYVIHVREKIKSRDVKAKAPCAPRPAQGLWDELNRSRNQLAQRDSIIRGLRIQLGKAWRAKSGDLYQPKCHVGEIPPDEVERLARKLNP